MSYGHSLEETINYIAQYPVLLNNILSRIPEDALIKQPDNGDWTIAQNVHHIADAHMNKYFQIRHILTEETPDLIEYKENLFVDLPAGNSGNLHDSMNIIEGLHGRMVALLKEINNEDSSRKGIHPAQGAILILDIVNTFVSHGKSHIDQIEKTLVSLERK